MKLRSLLVFAAICIPVLSGADLELVDGRILKNWKVMNVTAGFITIRHSGGATKIPKQLLPADVLAKFPIDPIAAAEAQRQAEESRAKAAEALAAAATIPGSMQERERLYRIGKEKQRLENLKEARRQEEARRAELAAERESEIEAERIKQFEISQSRDGLLLSRVRTNMASAVVSMKNVSSSSQSFDWRQLRARFRRGQVRQPTNIVVTDGKFGYLIAPGETRSFEIGFGTRIIGDEDWLDDVSWLEGVWVSYEDPSPPPTRARR